MPDVDQSCRVCKSGGDCYCVGMGAEQIWAEIEKRAHRLGLSNDPIWNCEEERAILNLMWHYRQREPAEQMKME